VNGLTQVQGLLLSLQAVMRKKRKKNQKAKRKKVKKKVVRTSSHATRK
jgi:hypothetical protein